MTATSQPAPPFQPTIDHGNADAAILPAEEQGLGEPQWLDAPAQEPTSAPGAGGRKVLGWGLALLAAAWLAFGAWSAGRALGGTALSAPLAAQWLAILSGPLALLGLAWVAFGRTRRKEAEAFTRSVVAMRSEARSLEGLLGVLRMRIDEHRSSLVSMAQQLMALGDEATHKFGESADRMADHSRSVVASGEAFDRAAQSAVADMGVLLADLPRAENSARLIGEALREATAQGRDGALQLEERTEALLTVVRQADESIAAATARLGAQLSDVEHRHQQAGAGLEQLTNASTQAIDDLLGRAAEALDDIRNGIDLQSQAVSALLDQAAGGIGKAGVDAAHALGERLQTAGGALEALGLRVVEQDQRAQRMLGDLDQGLAALDQRFQTLAEQGDERSARITETLARMRGELAAIEAQSAGQDSSLESVSERLERLRGAVVALSSDLAGELSGAIGDAEAGAARLVAASETARPLLFAARDAAIEAGERVEHGNAQVEAQHERLAALLAAVDTGIGGAERRLADLGEAIRQAEGEAQRLTGEAGPAMVAAMVQVREAASHAAERAREAIGTVIPASSNQLGEAAREALVRVVEQTVAAQMAEIEAAAQRAVESARGASERLMQQMISMGQSAAALEQHFGDRADAIREHDSETFAKRVSLLIDSMHSAAIDVGKILADEVDDRAWTAYLKGDRSVFTRRAARLLGHAEGRSLAAHYENDREFHEAVNRFVHDFEAMLRRVTSERDGGPMAVSLMGSDMGKLYAALEPVARR